MTKKDYALIASILYVANRHLTDRQAAELTDHACSLLKKDNPNFNKGLFVAEVIQPLTFIRKVLREG